MLSLIHIFETRYVGRDTRPIEPQVADVIARAMRADAGSLLAFLPGTAEILSLIHI